MQQAVTNSEHEVAFLQIRQHMRRHKHIGPKDGITRKTTNMNDEDVDHDEHVVHGDTKRDQTWRH